MSTPTNARGPLVFILANTTGVSTALRAGQVFRFVGVLMPAIAALWPTEPSIAVWMLAGAAMTVGALAAGVAGEPSGSGRSSTSSALSRSWGASSGSHAPHARAPHNVPHATTCGSAVARMLFRISMMS